MEVPWNNNRAHSRCKIKPADTQLAAAGHAASIDVREDKILDPLDTWLNGLFSPERRDETIDALNQAGEDPDEQRPRRAAQAALRSCGDRLRKYRAALEAGADPATVTSWIAEVTAERTRHQVELGRMNGRTRLSKDDITALVKNSPASRTYSGTRTRATGPRYTPNWASGSPTTTKNAWSWQKLGRTRHVLTHVSEGRSRPIAQFGQWGRDAGIAERRVRQMVEPTPQHPHLYLPAPGASAPTTCPFRSRFGANQDTAIRGPGSAGAPVRLLPRAAPRARSSADAADRRPRRVPRRGLLTPQPSGILNDADISTLNDGEHLCRPPRVAGSPSVARSSPISTSQHQFDRSCTVFLRAHRVTGHHVPHDRRTRTMGATLTDRPGAVMPANQKSLVALRGQDSGDLLDGAPGRCKHLDRGYFAILEQQLGGTVAVRRWARSRGLTTATMMEADWVATTKGLYYCLYNVGGLAGWAWTDIQEVRLVKKRLATVDIRIALKNGESYFLNTGKPASSALLRIVEELAGSPQRNDE